MRIPYVIDNQTYILAEVLRAMLQEHEGRALDIATAYFSISGYRELRGGLGGLGSLRLLLGFEPQAGADVGLRSPREVLRGGLRAEIEREPFSEATLQLVEDLVAFLQRPEVAVRLYERGFLHAKCYLFYADQAARGATFDRLLPLAGIVGSSNFTGPGLRSNKELNLAHKTLLDDDELDDPAAHAAVIRVIGPPAASEIPATARRAIKSEVGARALLDLERWYESQWETARDWKEELIELLDSSKFGARHYTPYEVYLKAIYEYLRDDLQTDATDAGTRSAIELAEFQEDAVRRARKILARYDGVIVGDSVGMGKTWIGKKLLEDFAYHQRMRAIVICPAALRDMWQQELAGATIAAQVLTQEALGQASGRFDPRSYGDADVILIDESHNFRNRTTQRYENLELLIGANRGRGRAGNPKKLIMLTATPINNDIFDLYNQIALFTRNDRAYFAAAGIGDLQRYFAKARRDGYGAGSGVALFNLLEEVVIRRTRPFIRAAYPEATINGQRVRWPERRLHTVRYDLEATYAGIYEQVVAGIDGLQLAHYNLESFKKTGVKRDEFEEGREQALVGIFKSRYLKRFESSIEAFRISVRRALTYVKTYEEYLLGGTVLDSRSFTKVLRFLQHEDEEDDATPGSVAEDLDLQAEARAVLDTLPALETPEYDLRKLHRALQQDVDILTAIWMLIKDIKPEHDAKLQRLKDLLGTELHGTKVLVFTYYKDTARYLYRELTGEHGTAWRASNGDPSIRRMDSGLAPRDRGGLIQAFSPRSNGRPEISGTPDEIDIMLATDVLSEGQNLQDCGVLVNYDLHWNPTRMVQRAGRIDRIGSSFETINIFNMFPDAGLERLLGLVQSLSIKIQSIDQTGFLDASVLGETVHPQNFNTLKRIADEDGTVIEEQERMTDLVSTEFLEQQLRVLLASGAREQLESLPDGIHSGLARGDSKGLFFYFTAPDRETGGRHHFWRYYDAHTRQIVDNRYVITELIKCSADTPRVISELNVFEIQERIIADILQSAQTQVAVEAAPAIVDLVQQTLVTLLSGYLNSPAVKRTEVRGLIAELRRPATTTQIKRLKEAYTAFNAAQDIAVLLAQLNSIVEIVATPVSNNSGSPRLLTREDLRLICFDHVVG